MGSLSSFAIIARSLRHLIGHHSNKLRHDMFSKQYSHGFTLIASIRVFFHMKDTSPRQSTQATANRSEKPDSARLTDGAAVVIFIAIFSLVKGFPEVTRPWFYNSLCLHLTKSRAFLIKIWVEWTICRIKFRGTEFCIYYWIESSRRRTRATRRRTAQTVRKHSPFK